MSPIIVLRIIKYSAGDGGCIRLLITREKQVPKPEMHNDQDL